MSTVTVSKDFPNMQAADAFIASYLQNYHPCGYDTAVKEKKELPDGQVHVVITRYSSCD